MRDGPATVLRAAMVVGAGSTSFELMRRMSERVPVVPVPSWMRRELQPLAVEDVVLALTRALDGRPLDRHYDIGGDEVLTYRELLALFADVAGLWRPQFVVPLVPHRVVSEIVALVAQIPRGTVNALVESLSHDMVCQEDDVRTDLLPGHREARAVEDREEVGRERDSPHQPRAPHDRDVMPVRRVTDRRWGPRPARRRSLRWPRSRHGASARRPRASA